MKSFIHKTLSNFIDGLTKQLTTIGSDHAYIHQGRAFKVPAIATINDGATLKFAFTTPNAEEEATDQKYVHWRPIEISTTTAGVPYVLYRNDTGDSDTGGSDVTPQNRNESHSRTSKMQIFKSGVTVTPTGTVVQTGTFGSGAIPARASGGGGFGDVDEIILKSNTEYFVVLTNLGGANSSVAHSFNWYEENKYKG